MFSLSESKVVLVCMSANFHVWARSSSEFKVLFRAGRMK
jgi:hypothetical protein